MRDLQILVVDDEPANLRLLELTLAAAGFNRIFGTTRSAAAVGLYETRQPDLLVLDLMMPAPDGYAVMDQILASFPRERGFRFSR